MPTCPLWDKLYGCDQFLNWSPQGPTGALQLDGFESLFECEKNQIPKWASDFLAEDEGFEPPQTESESGVLPLHKSSICGTFILYPNLRKSQGKTFRFLNFFESAPGGLAAGGWWVIALLSGWSQWGLRFLQNCQIGAPSGIFLRQRSKSSRKAYVRPGGS